jgi:transmembrane sensor
MMSDHTAADVEAEAAAWVARLDRLGRTPVLMAELAAWLDEDPRRRGALLRAEAGWVSMNPPAPELPMTEDDFDAEPPRRYSRRWLLAGGGSAAAALVAAGLLVLLPRVRYDTKVGEIRRVPLADGSTATVNTASSIDVVIGSRAREIRLQRGEAWFQVEKDRARPFVVEAGRVRVRAIGTAFAVRRREGGADVLVSEGVVEAWAAGAEGHTVRLSAGQRAYVADNAAIVEHPVEPSGVDRALAWREGKIDLNGETLGEAVAEFNRYNRRQIDVIDPRAAAERFHGVFRLDDPEGFARAIHQSLGVPVRLDDPTRIVVGGTE